MLPITGAKTKRFKHFHPEPGTDAYREGQEQAKLNLESYHYIRALILGEYTIVDHVGPESDAPPDEKHTSPKKQLDFSQYTGCELRMPLDVEVRLQEGGTVSPEDLKTCRDSIKVKHWISNGDILDALQDHRQAFFSIMINYNSTAKTTGDAAWDAFFNKLKEDGVPQKNIKCPVSSSPQYRVRTFF